MVNFKILGFISLLLRSFIFSKMFNEFDLNFYKNIFDFENFKQFKKKSYW